jgi:ADP-ribosyl-[dinitrogen reductase] hydrolase
VPPRILDSLNSPLQVGHLPVGPHLGAVGFTICPGKQQANSMSGQWKRDLSMDLDAIRSWGAAAVVTLMPMDELRAVHADGIGEACEARGMEWFHLPVRDVDVPDAHFETQWCYAGLRLREHLRQGRRVLVHCRGGLGRSGTIAARLLVEMGWSPNEAIAAVRAQRPGAIETRAQEQYVRQLGGAVSEREDACTARVLGCVLGGAVGDAFGYAIEFDRWSDIQRKHGPQGLVQPVLRHGRLVVSDDTQMTLFTLEALNVSLPAQGDAASDAMHRPFMTACQHAYLRWGHTQGEPTPDLYDDGPLAQLSRCPAMRHRRAPGHTCLSAIRAGAWGTLDSPINDSKGCGAVMRIAPIGLLQSASPSLAYELGCMAGALTHGHPDGWLPAGLLAAMIRLLLDGESVEHATEKALEIGQRSGRAEGARTPRMIAAALRLSSEQTPSTVAYATLGEGWTGDEALAIGVYAAVSNLDYVDAVRMAANHDGDSDSTASIAGQLVGTRDGICAVPHAWVRRLDVLPEALAAIANFIKLNNLRRAPRLQ